MPQEFIMFTNYFESFGDLIVQDCYKARPRGARGAEDKEALASIDIPALLTHVQKITPNYLKLGQADFIDPSGFSPSNTDFIAYRELYPDIMSIMNGKIPSELVYGAFFVLETLSRETLVNTLLKIVNTKKINQYSSGEPEEKGVIPSFVIAFASDMKLKDVKEEIFGYYTNKNINHQSEFDIIVIINKGIIIKDWREKRSYVALETGKDTMKWFFVLMNEYFDGEQGRSLDLREYIRDTRSYNEY